MFQANDFKELAKRLGIEEPKEASLVGPYIAKMLTALLDRIEDVEAELWGDND